MRPKTININIQRLHKASSSALYGIANVPVPERGSVRERDFGGQTLLSQLIICIARVLHLSSTVCQRSWRYLVERAVDEAMHKEMFKLYFILTRSQSHL